MGSSKKRLKQVQKSESEMGSEEENEFVNEDSADDETFDASDDGYFDEEGNESENGDSSGEDEKQADDDDDSEHDEGIGNIIPKDDELEELQKEYQDLRNTEQKLVHTLKRHKDEDVVKGQAIKNQKALWDKALEIRILMQNAYRNSNKLPQEPIRSLFLESDEAVSVGYSDLIASSKKAIDSLLQLQEALLDNNPSIARASEEGNPPPSLIDGELKNMDVDQQKEWLKISQIQSRIASFRNKSVDKWQRKADVHSGAAAKKAKLLAFNQNISDQVATYMRDPSKMIRGMQMRRETVGVFGPIVQQAGSTTEEANPEGDPELLYDNEFYQQLLNEFIATVDPSSSETAFYALKKLQTKKRKVVDRRASKSRKIRYNIHEKLVNFMAPQPMDIPEMAPKLFQNLFGLKTQKSTAAA
ncbi:hypothetical protein RND81_01G185400 [Saponaria officinalis]|uniref:Protein AATF n=1 Tax=Saponaria officinalis TaxID=3572 RepID=A0AAW1NFR4_SAPOF